MVHSHLAPQWFYGIDIVLEAVFAVVCLLVALASYRIYARTGEKQVRNFSVAFFLFCISYAIQSLLNFMIAAKLLESVCTIAKIQSVAHMEWLAISTHILFMTAGLSLLLYTTLKAGTRVFWLLLLLAFSGLLLSSSVLYTFYLTASLFLFFISWHYVQNYTKKRELRQLLVATAFVFLLFGNFHFLISVNHSQFYAIGHILELVAYILILWNLFIVHRK